MHRKGVSAIIVDSKNRFLLVNLESFGEQYFAFPGGGIEPGEPLEAAVYRELQEELCIEKDSLQYVGKSEVPVNIKLKESVLNRDGNQYDGLEKYFFGFQFIGDVQKIVVKEGEVRMCKWVPFSELKDYLLFEGQLDHAVAKIKEIFPELYAN